MTDIELLELAKEARKKSYSPYSNFAVGAALLAKNGQVYLGCNIENAGFSATNCAERIAFFKAVSEGVTSFEKIAIVGGKHGEDLQFCPPCGVCRQVMMEFCNPKTFQVVMGTCEADMVVETLEGVMPYGFGPGDLAD